jgi:hypothetical protein
VLAEQVVGAEGVELVAAQRVVAAFQLQGVGLDQHAPVARLDAETAVALAGAVGQVDLRAETHLLAVAAAVIGLEHGGASR